MTKIDLITGILGAGKTTFLLKYARACLDRGERIAVLENDFGAVNVDMLLLQELKCENCQLEMVSGCNDPYCHRRRFRTQLIALGMQHFDRIIVEPSGIFDMDEFFDLLYESPLDKWYQIGSILTIADAQNPTARRWPRRMRRCSSRTRARQAESGARSDSVQPALYRSGCAREKLGCADAAGLS